MADFLKQHGLDLAARPYVMGILNVTPDSFSDGGELAKADALLARVDTMVRAGVDLIDIGGESTRPFAAPVSLEEELRRVIPAIVAIRDRYKLPISIDTTKAEVARQACVAGANIINDISAMQFDPAMAAVAVEFDTPAIIMHMRGTPQDMQTAPAYDDVVAEIVAFLRARLQWLATNGIPPERVIVDPGIGFGKSLTHNLAILNHLESFTALGCPVLVGHSRKSFLGKLLDLAIDDRDLATAVVSALCVAKGAAILRVHDVGSTVQAVRLARNILAA